MIRTVNWKERIKGSWDWKNNMGDHRAVVVNLKVQINKSNFDLNKKGTIKKGSIELED